MKQEGQRSGDQNLQTESLLARVSEQLSHLEKRDWQLWLIVVVIGISMGTGLLGVMFPAAFLKDSNVEFQFKVSKTAFLGLLVLLVLANMYAVSRRVEFRRLRQQLISNTMQSELVRLQSFTDPLTEVYNRRSLDDVVNRYVCRARRTHQPLTFLMIDVDRFRDVNTRFGHLTGDLALAEVAAILRNSVRGSDAVVRYGGDEFLIILGESSTAGAARVIERINKYVDEWNRGGHLQGTSLSLSIGVSEWVDGKSLAELLDETDRNMYAAKTVSSDPS